VQADIVHGRAKHLRHLQLCQPERLPVQVDFNGLLALGEDKLVV